MADPLADSESALAQQIFLKAVDEIPAQQWDQYVRDACGQNASLQARVEELLEAHKVVSGYFDKPPTILASLSKPQSMSNLTGTVVDGYKLAQQIGQGGMGVVYIAHQSQPVRRQVAFKVVKPGMDTKQVIARFEIERRALAMMDHPNIAHVFDAVKPNRADRISSWSWCRASRSPNIAMTPSYARGIVCGYSSKSATRSSMRIKRVLFTVTSNPAT